MRKKKNKGVKDYVLGIVCSEPTAMRRPGKLTPVNGDVRNENSQIVTSSKRPLLKEKKKKKKLSIFEKRVYKIRKRKTRNYFSFFISERRQNVTMTFTSPPPRTQPDM